LAALELRNRVALVFQLFKVGEIDKLARLVNISLLARRHLTLELAAEVLRVITCTHSHRVDRTALCTVNFDHFSWQSAYSPDLPNPLLAAVEGGVLACSEQLRVVLGKLLGVKTLDRFNLLVDLLDLLLVILAAFFFFLVVIEVAEVAHAVLEEALLLDRLDRVSQPFVDHDALVVDRHAPAHLHLLTLGPQVDRIRVDHRRLGLSSATARLRMRSAPFLRLLVVK